VDSLLKGLWMTCGKMVDDLGIELFVAWGYQVEKPVSLLCKSDG
jgi:hypothetical protein